MTMQPVASTFDNANQVSVNNLANNTDEDDLNKINNYMHNTITGNKNNLPPPLVHQPSTETTAPSVFPKHSTLSESDAAEARRLGVKSLHIKNWLLNLPRDVQQAILSLFYDLCTSEYQTKTGFQITIDAPYGEDACDPTPSNHCRKVQRHYSGDDIGPVDENGNVRRPAYANGTGLQTVGISPQ